MRVAGVARLALPFVVACSVFDPSIELSACESHLDCYSIASADPFACWRCDKKQKGGTCVQSGAPKRQKPIGSVPEGQQDLRLRAFDVGSALLVVAEQEPLPGQAVARSFTTWVGKGATSGEPLLHGFQLSQLAVTRDEVEPFCLAVSHDGVGAKGNICFNACADVCHAICAGCDMPRKPSLAVGECDRDGQDCVKLAAFVDPDVRAYWSRSGDDVHSLDDVPKTLDPGCGPLALRVETDSGPRLLLVACDVEAPVPRVGVLTERAADFSLVFADGDDPRPGAGKLVAVAAAAATGSDAHGDFLLSWIVETPDHDELHVAEARLAEQHVAPLQEVFVHELPHSMRRSLSVAFARHGPPTDFAEQGPGGWAVAYVGADMPMMLRVDRRGSEPILQQLTDLSVEAADLVDFAVAPQPPEGDGASPFIYLGLTSTQVVSYQCSD